MPVLLGTRLIVELSLHHYSSASTIHHLHTCEGERTSISFQSTFEEQLLYVEIGRTRDLRTRKVSSARYAIAARVVLDLHDYSKRSNLPS